ncbi:MAG: N-acetyl sugar amidotransferase, partial [Candidatus Omnitrophota bacterium]
PSAKEQINNDVAKSVDFGLWHKNGITDSRMNMFKYPSPEEIENIGLEPIFLSYFVPWNGYDNYKIAKEYGFKDLTGEWKRDGYIDDYDQIDSVAYLMNVWMKYPKFGFGRATDVVGYWIRAGRITREEGRRLIEENDHKLDARILKDFLDFTGYTEKEFWNIVEKFWNRDIFEKAGVAWRLKEPCLGSKVETKT